MLKVEENKEVASNLVSRHYIGEYIFVERGGGGIKKFILERRKYAYSVKKLSQSIKQLIKITQYRERERESS